MTTELRRTGSSTAAGGLLVTFSIVVAANWVLAVVRGVGTGPLDVAFVAAVVLVAGAAAWGLGRGRAWARPLAYAISLGALFFIAPVVGTILLGGGTDPVGTGWDVVYFPLMTVLLLAVLVLLVRSRVGRGAERGHG